MRGAIVGGGSIGRRHLRNLKSLGVDVVGVFDPDPAVCRSIAEHESTECFRNLDDLWPLNPQFVVIASPPAVHIAQSLAAEKRGCHLLIEKPLALTMDGVAKLRDAVDRRGLITMVACNMRFHPGPATIKRLLNEGAVGDVLSARVHTGSYLPQWRPWQNYRESYSASPDCGAILDCIHEVDLAMWYFGPATVIGAAVRPAASLGLQTDGLAEVLLAHRTGTLTSLHLNFVQRDYKRSCQIIGTEGSLYWDFASGQVLLYGSDGVIRSTFAQPPDWELNQMYADEVAHFLNCVRTGEPTSNSLDGGVATLELALAARAAGKAATA